MVVSVVILKHRRWKLPYKLVSLADWFVFQDFQMSGEPFGYEAEPFCLTANLWSSRHVFFSDL